MTLWKAVQQLLFPSYDKRPAHLRVGTDGESIARRYLRRQRYRVLAQNVRVGKHDEVDLIAYDPVDAVLAFVEVKSRAKNDADYAPELNLTPEKRRRISRAARRWIASNDYPGGYRLDLLCIADGSVTAHYRDIEFC